MEDTLISFETAKLAKEKGFKMIRCFYHYLNENSKLEFTPNYNMNTQFCMNNDAQPELIAVPTQSLLQKWLKEKHNINVFVMFSHMDDYFHRQTYKYKIIKNKSRISQMGDFKTYEVALEAGLFEGLKLI